MSVTVEGKRLHIARAALGVFVRYGYRRTSMDLLAQAARMSRPAVYQHFKNKQEIFLAAATLVTEKITAAAREAGAGDQAAAERIYRVLVVKLNAFSDAAPAEFHADLFTEAADIAPDLVRSFEEDYRNVIEAALIDCAELDLLETVLPARDCAALLLDALKGITQTQHDIHVKRTRLLRLAELTVRGLTGTSQESSAC
ncbi:TetR/AcrR family transcriptional regulator [Streptomyces sp. NPDC087263]|uniref:TetR/AcrR family transcriptional regulator n=1 Tax=Streptomyces sp. NPDC087263 TaxID=3365773 RepID=UPI0037FFADE6